MTFTRRAWLGVATASLAVAMTSRSEAQADPLLLAKSWIGGEARPIKPEPRNDADLSDLIGALAGVQLIGLGEATHGSHEDFQLKADLIATMARAGRIDVLVLEANRLPGELLDAWVQGRGEETATEALVASKLFRIWQCREMAGLLEVLRQCNAVRPGTVRIIGVDIQSPDVDLDHALARLKAVAPQREPPVRAALTAALSGFPVDRRADALASSITAAKMAEALTMVRALEIELISLGDADGAYAARAGLQGLEAFEYETADGDKMLQTSAYFARRDVSMGENAVARLGDRRGALWAHNSHIGAFAGEGEEAGYVSLGYTVRQGLGPRYAAVIVDFETARFNAVPKADQQGQPEVRTVGVLERRRAEGSLGAFLGDVGPDRFWVSLRDAPAALQGFRDHAFGIDWPGWYAPETITASALPKYPLRDGADFLVFFRTLTPSQRLPA